MKKIVLSAIVAMSLSVALFGCKSNVEKDVVKEPAKASTESSLKSEPSESKQDKKEIPVENEGVPQESKKEVSQESKKEGPVENKKEIKVQSRKQEYKNKLANIDKELKSSKEAKEAESGVTYAMKIYANKQYESWDKALNEIYSVLKQQLPADEMKKVQAEEIQWIKEKEDKAKKAASEFEGGTFAGVAYSDSLAQTTKARCYELVDRYMK